MPRLCSQWWVLILLPLIAGCASSGAAPPTRTNEATANPAAPSLMRVHCIDVGQGAATLLEFADGAVLIDTGGEDNDTVHSDELLASYLEQFFATRPDLHHTLGSLFLTHPHLDHTRGVSVVLAHAPPRHVVTNGQVAGSGAEQQNELKAWAVAHSVALDEVNLESIPPAGLTDAAIDPVHGTDVDPAIRVLWGQVASDPGWGVAFGKARFTNCNNHCLVVRVDFGKASVLITGDLEEPAIKDMLTRYAGTGLLDVDVYVVGHHGSVNGTTPELVQAMTPKMAVIECGRPDHDASYCAWAFGHPRQEVVAMLESGLSERRGPREVRLGWGARQFEAAIVGSALYSTAWDGDVVLDCHADDWIQVSTKTSPGQ